MSHPELDRSTLNLYLARLCGELGSPPVALDDANEAGLAGEIQGRQVSVSVTFHPSEKLVVLLSPIGETLSGAPAENLPTALLSLNVSPRDLGGVCFALDPRSSTVLLVYSLIDPELRYSTFRSAFLRLFAVAAEWKGKLLALHVAAEKVKLPVIR